MSGVSELIRLCALTDGDVFADIGSGVGNIIAQVALQTDVKAVVGIEMRVQVAELGQQLMKDASQSSPQLKKVCVVAGDIRSLQYLEDDRTKHITVLFAHNNLFEGDAVRALHEMCCVLPDLRRVALTVKVCPRHRPWCFQEFCVKWKQTEDGKCAVTFKSALVPVYIYDRIESI